MIKWIKDKIDDFIWWITDDMNIWFLILALIGFIYMGTTIYLIATGKEVRIPKTQPIIYLPR